MPGVLEKLKILSFSKLDDGKLSAPDGKVFIAYFNPESYSVSYGIEYETEQPINSTGNPGNYMMSAATTYSFELVLDGTGLGGLSLSNPIPRSVKQRVKDFIDVTAAYEGKAHRPNFLRLIWGSLTADVVLETLDITYNLFAPDGSPLRAKLSTGFREVVSFEMMQAKKKASSPDLTHVHTVKNGDTLANLCRQVYGDPRLYQEVAAANGLVNFRKLSPGSKIYFPPLKNS